MAYHEAGHALVACALPNTDPVHKVSIIPRGVGALGYTIQRPTEDRFLMTREELEGKLVVLLGGRSAEGLVFEHTSTGASDPGIRTSSRSPVLALRSWTSGPAGPLPSQTTPWFVHRGPPGARFSHAASPST